MFSNPQQNVALLDIQDGMKVVDLGSGSGFYTIEAAKRVGPRGMVYAVDVQRELLDKVKNSAALIGLHNIEIVWGNAEKIGGTKLREAIADRVILSNILFQIDQTNRDDLVLEVKRLLRPGGKLMVIDWTAESPMGPRSSAGSHVVPPIVAEGLFTKVGFVVDKTFDAGDHHYGIIFKR